MEEGLLIIGAGLGRTGTLSVKHALEELGYPCYHMEEVLRRGHFKRWLNHATGVNEMAWNEVFRGYKATVDFPACLCFRQLMAEYPEAKVLLTVRDSEGWWRSFSNTLLEGRRVLRSSFWLNRFARVRLMNRFQDEAVFWIFGDEPIGKAQAVRAFEDHNMEVQAAVPADRLLVFNVKEGWGPLCSFLGSEVPSCAFPHVNDKETFVKRIRVIRLARSHPGTCN